MTEVISVKFKNRGKSYYFAPNGKVVKTGEQVIVETSKGLEIADCARGNHMVEDTAVIQPLRPVVRVATKDDLRVAEINKQREKEAYEICRKKIVEHGLDMKLVDVECNFEGNKTMFFFTSDGRVDFRELVKDLAGIFRNRIELRQIGVRDEAKMLGGLGICGRPFCCSKFLNDFQPVSTKMAKMQSMSLNPSKISGSCGRLMCCLRYEQEAYEELVKNVPKQGAFVETPTGYGIVTQVNLLRQLVKVKLDGEGEDTLRTFRAVEVATVPGGRPKDGEPLPSVLKYVPAPEPEEEPEDEWAIPELLISDTVEEKPEKPENTKKNRNRRNRRGGRSRTKSEGEKPAAQPKPKTEEEKQPVKAKPKPKRGGGNKPRTGDKPKTESTPAQPKPQQKSAEPKEGGDKKRTGSRRRYYHRGKPKNRQGGEQKQ
ncbi:MAG TPA: hypothetical protein DIT84_07905 [Clostridiales bacterium]|nr:hypothetical protein [Clostridiales bacterium]